MRQQPRPEMAAATIQRLPDPALRRHQFAQVQGQFGNRYAAQLARHLATAGQPAGSLQKKAAKGKPKAKDKAKSNAKPVSKPTLQAALARQLLQKVFGPIAGRPIKVGSVIMLPSEDKLNHMYDMLNRRYDVYNKDTGKIWKYGDRARWLKRRGLHSAGFKFQNRLFINGAAVDPATTIHEILHLNTAKGFGEAAGKSIEEGVTQRFALRVLKKTGHSLKGSERTYPRELDIVDRLVKRIGEKVLEMAYFKNAQLLPAFYDRHYGERAFEILKRTLDGSAAGFRKAKRLLKPPSPQTVIWMIRSLLHAWSDASDLDIVASILKNVADSAKKTVRDGILPFIANLPGRKLKDRFLLMLSD